MRTKKRRRHEVPGVCLAAMRPLLRYSHNRDAYVLRVAGGRFGPVLTERDASESQAASGAAPDNDQ
jgi:hypothetical protein